MVEQTRAEAPPAPRAASQAGKKSRSRWWILLGALALLVVVGGAYWYTQHSGRTAQASETAGAADREPAAGSVTRVEVVTPTPHGLPRTTTQPGSVQAFRFAKLYAQVSGYLKEQTVDIGDKVKKGDVLAEIEAPAYVEAVRVAEAAVSQAEAKVSVAESQVDTAEANYKAAKAKIAQAKADVEKAQASVKYRESQLARIKQLVRSQSIERKVQDEEQDRYDAAVADLHAYQANVQTDEAEADAAAAKVEEMKSDVEEAKADRDRAKADLRRAEVFVGFTRIVSPYTGVITLRSFNAGDFINLSSEGSGVPLLQVAITDKMRVVLLVPDRDVPYVDVGDPAVVRIDALPGRDFKGKVARYSHREDPSDRTMRTEIDLDNPEELLHDGMYGGVTITLAPASKDHLSLPTRCLHDVTEDGNGAVFVVRDGKAKRLPVKVGRDNGREIEILSGLGKEERVVFRYNGALADGTAVQAETVRPEPEQVAAH